MTTINMESNFEENLKKMIEERTTFRPEYVQQELTDQEKIMIFGSANPPELRKKTPHEESAPVMITFMAVEEHGKPYTVKAHGRPKETTRMAVMEHGQPHKITTSMAVREHGKPYKLQFSTDMAIGQPCEIAGASRFEPDPTPPAPVKAYKRPYDIRAVVTKMAIFEHGRPYKNITLMAIKEHGQPYTNVNVYSPALLPAGNRASEYSTTFHLDYAAHNPGSLLDENSSRRLKVKTDIKRGDTPSCIMF